VAGCVALRGLLAASPSEIGRKASWPFMPGIRARPGWLGPAPGRRGWLGAAESRGQWSKKGGVPRSGVDPNFSFVRFSGKVERKGGEKNSK
jgi:hypothetical protein